MFYCKIIGLKVLIYTKFQGILGLAYSAIAVGSPDITAQPWLDFIDIKHGITKSFELTLCGIHSINNVTHYGNFTLLGK